MSWLHCNYDPFSDEDVPDLNFSFNPNAPLTEQLANLLFRFSEYRRAHKHILGSLNTVSHEHYRVCDTKTLLQLKQPIQVMLFSREMLEKIDIALEKDITTIETYLTYLQETLKNGSGEKDKPAKKNSKSV